MIHLVENIPISFIYGYKCVFTLAKLTRTLQQTVTVAALAFATLGMGRDAQGSQGKRSHYHL